jgi:hypothetical protein
VVPELRRKDAIGGDGRSAALHVPEHSKPRLDPRPVLDLVGEPGREPVATEDDELAALVADERRGQPPGPPAPRCWAC